MREQKQLEWRKLVVEERRVEQIHGEAAIHSRTIQTHAFNLPLVLFSPALGPRMYLS